ncbi:DUF4148 domain-containing protein [Pseudomonas shahriarae]|jgi:hypothetical protein|uniref:DUF4148 domain-containing protein n=1 Tax=Pseudomonas shahriarae TaxID=2745512 RepID=A0A9X4C8G5_9PSED|nr:DUF4148 domain-containing protein [Pseudomonas shahriarae]MDD1012055.1 DUF4148 domain-containing protein [Pseudomonas shahriarae]
MKSRQWIVAVIAASAMGAAGSALADYTGRFDVPVAASSKTRAEVRTELEQARAAGLLMRGGEGDSLHDWIRTELGAAGVAGSRYSGCTRAEVRAEAIEHAKKFKSGNDELYGR